MWNGGKVAEDSSDQINFIRQKLQTVSWVILFTLFIFQLLIVKFIYSFMDYLPMASVVGVLVIAAALGVMCLYLSKVAMTKAVDAIEGYSGKMRTLVNSTRELQHIDHSDVLLKNIVESAVKMLGADGGTVLLRDEEQLVFKVVRGGNEQALEGFKIPDDEGIVGWVVQHGKTVRANDAKHDSRYWPEVDRMVGHDTSAVLCAPLELHSKTIGALELVGDGSGVFGQEDEEILSHFAAQAALSIEKTEFMESEKNYEIHLTNILTEALESLSEKHGHARRVAKYTLMMADAVGMQERRKQRLYQASILHDIGFLKLRLDKISSPEEYTLHPEHGYEMLKPINFYADIAPFVLHHHERFDGKGYPAGYAGEEIPLESRMLFIAEAFDAMVSRHSYKKVGKVLSEDVIPRVVDFAEAVSELKKHAGSQFDPRLVEAFLQNISEEDIE